MTRLPFAPRGGKVKAEKGLYSSRADGEINVPLSRGLIKESHIAGEIGEVITGKKKGRTSDQDITAVRLDRDRVAGFGNHPARV